MIASTFSYTQGKLCILHSGIDLKIGQLISFDAYKFVQMRSVARMFQLLRRYLSRSQNAACMCRHG